MTPQHLLLSSIACALAILAPRSAFAAAGDVDSYFNPGITGSGVVWAVAVQDDGKSIVGGTFTSVNGESRSYLVRFSTTGALDTTFTPSLSGFVRCIAVQPDGKILIGGDFTHAAGALRSKIARLESDGTLDTTFNPGVSGGSAVVHALALQSNGSIIVGGSFTTLAGTTRNNIGRINSNGVIDSTFNPNTNGTVYSVLVQSDDRVAFGGSFTTVGGVTRNRIARMTSTGVLDGFNPNANGTVRCLISQPDGRLVLGGDFTTVQGSNSPAPTTRNRMARVDWSGDLETAFNPNVANTVNSLALQTDGKILLGGLFQSLQPPGSASAVNQKYIARLTSSGTIDSPFDPVVNGEVTGLTLQNDGKILLGGQFTSITGATDFTTVTTNYFGRLANDAVSESLTVPSLSQIIWNRSGALPELSHVSVQRSPDGGATWSSLGSMSRDGTTSNWSISGLNLEAAGDIRVFGRTSSGLGNGSGSIIYKRIGYSGLAAPEIEVRGNNVIISANDTTPIGGDHTDFGSVTTAGSGTLVRTFTIYNRGGLNLNIGSVSMTGGISNDPFTVTGMPQSTVPPGGSTTVQVTFAPSGSQIGTIQSTLQISNNDANEGPFTFRVQAIGVNSPPSVAYPIPDRIATEDSAFSYTFPTYTFSDPDSYDGSTLTFTTSARPAWLSFTSDPFSFSGTFSGTPGNSDVGYVDITVTATDNQGAQATDTFRLTVANVNDPPTVATPIPNQNATEDVAFSYTFPANTFADIDAGNVFTYSVTNKPSWLNFNAATRTFSGTPTNSNVGFTDITVTATDNGSPTPASVSDTFRLTVNNVNDAPTVAIPIPNQTATEDTAFSYTFPSNTFADVDAGNVFTYSVTGKPAWLTFNAATRTFSGTPTDAEVGFTDITVTATDNGTPATASVSDIFRLTVNNVNDMPGFTKGGDLQLATTDPAAQVVGGWATGIQDGDATVVQTLTFNLTPDNPALFLVPPAIDSNGTLTFTLAGGSGQSTVTVTLTDDATAGGPALTTAPQAFTITVRSALETWRLANFETTENSGQAADNADFDLDGVTNLIEFAFGMNPKVADAHKVPQPEWAGGELVFSYSTPEGVSGITYGAESSETLLPDDWQSVTDTGTSPNHVFSVPTTGRQRLFLRHKITAP